MCSPAISALASSVAPIYLIKPTRYSQLITWECCTVSHSRSREPDFHLPGGHFFLVILGSPSHTAKVLTTPSWMLCPVSSPPIPPVQNPVPFGLPPASLELLPGKRRTGSWRCNKWQRILVTAPGLSFCSSFCLVNCPAVGAGPGSPATLASPGPIISFANAHDGPP